MKLKLVLSDIDDKHYEIEAHFALCSGSFWESDICSEERRSLPNPIVNGPGPGPTGPGVIKPGVIGPGVIKPGIIGPGVEGTRIGPDPGPGEIPGPSF